MIFTDDQAAAAGNASGLLHPVANVCNSGSCPTVYVDPGTDKLIVQGFSVSAEHRGIDLPAGEALVEIPKELLAEALRNLS